MKFETIVCILVALLGLDLHSVTGQRRPTCEMYGCSQRCVFNRRGQVTCLCWDGYVLANDGRTCYDIDECAENNHGCSDICVNTRGSAGCSCPAGHALDADGKTCHVIQSLLAERPQAPKISTFSCDISEVCTPDCILAQGGRVVCSCPKGFRLNRNSNTCHDIDECLHHRFGCSYRCLNTMGSARCYCPTGYQLYRNGKTCFDINECLKNNFECSHKCVNIRGSAKCVCPVGYSLDGNGKTCIDIDECSVRHRNRCPHDCINTPGSYSCSCLQGYVAISEYSCKGCDENSYMTFDGKARCHACPPNSYTEGPAKTSVGDCKCLPGFIGDLSQNIPCTDVNECYENNFNCSHECINTPGSAFCTCPPGYQTDTDLKTCIDIDECSVKNGGCEGKCYNYEGGFNCSCTDGYRTADIYTCADIDECEENISLCSQKCINFPGGYYCSCNEDFKLEMDQKSCTAISCPRVSSPLNGKMKCYDIDKNKKNSLPDYADLTISTRCDFTCDSGYKINIPGSITCMKDGNWDAIPPKCIQLQCPALEIPENGDVYPQVCKKGHVDVLQKCYFTCKPGYQLVGRRHMFLCTRNRTWKPNKQKPLCEPIKIKPYIVCPGDITVELPTGQGSAAVYVAGPETNVDVANLKWQPEWIKVDREISFPAGVTEIVFQAFNSSTSCSMRVNVLDKEPPEAVLCPESFGTEASGILGTDVVWQEPVFTDNVEVSSVTINSGTNSTYRPGIHNVIYTAFDAAGNIGTCEFTINITSPKCGTPVGPSNGSANCNDWTLGRICEPTCEPGYVLYPQEPYLFMCDDSGTWNPSNVIQDCTPFVAAENSNCADGFELQVHIDTGEEICVHCPANLFWSHESQMCTEEIFPEDSKSNYDRNNGTEIY